MNYFIFSIYSTTIAFAAGFICGYIYQEVIVNGTINS